MTDSNYSISVVIPLFNEEESLPELTEKIHTVATRMGVVYEIIFVDDGSTDNSYTVIQKLKQQYAAVKALRFRKNFGKSTALSEGFKMATGTYVITMDADLQDDPEEIPHLVNKLQDGNDLVSGWKKVRHDPVSKTIPSRFFNFVTRVMSGIRLHDFNCGLKAYRREVVKDVNLYGELHRYIPVLAKWEGYRRITEIVVHHHPRKYGQSKFGLSRFLKGFLDLITVVFLTRYVKRPLHFFGFFGSLSLLAGLGICGYLSLDWFLGTPIGQRPILFLGILLIMIGFQIISTGLIGEMLVHNFNRQKEVPVKERIE
ncbi:glycosyltransferase family 2 protein [bacterium]|nr:glycosyltransferase family 2 protein [bacterium]NUN45554.1 glycosyltransferase family 2 protein [bacterium]